MDKFTKEQQVQAIYDLKVGYTLGHADIAMLKSMARQLLASMEQEPVAYMYRDNLHTDARFSLEKRFGNWSQEDINEYEITEIPLYAAPQLPQSSVPLVNLPSEFYSSEGVMVQLEKVMAALAVCGIQYRRKWNACRVAMLQAGNSPVTPDGYALVPKEITCAMDDAAWEAYHETRCMSDIWAALLAAAPQQEVK